MFFNLKENYLVQNVQKNTTTRDRLQVRDPSESDLYYYNVPTTTCPKSE